MEIEEPRLALEVEEHMNKRVPEECDTIMDPSRMDERASQYWELTREDILAKSFGGRGGNVDSCSSDRGINDGDVSNGGAGDDGASV